LFLSSREYLYPPPFITASSSEHAHRRPAPSFPMHGLCRRYSQGIQVTSSLSPLLGQPISGPSPRPHRRKHSRRVPPRTTWPCFTQHREALLDTTFLEAECCFQPYHLGSERTQGRWSRDVGRCASIRGIRGSHLVLSVVKAHVARQERSCVIVA